MDGRADKGLLITTGTFTREARAEAQRDGARPIDLVDGEELVEKLKQLRIGVEVQERIVEEVVIREDYFKNTERSRISPGLNPIRRLFARTPSELFSFRSFTQRSRFAPTPG